MVGDWFCCIEVCYNIMYYFYNLLVMDWHFKDILCLVVLLFYRLYYDEGAHCVNRGCVALTLISKFRVIPQLERFRFFS